MNKIFCKVVLICIINILFGCDKKKPTTPVVPNIMYVINLDRTPERFKNVKERLNAFGFNPIRFSAVDGFNISLVNNTNEKIITGKEQLTDLRKNINTAIPESYYVKYNGQYQNAEFNLVTKYKFSAGEIGVIFSHRAIWQDIVDNKYKYAVVFEDDIIPLKNFRKNLLDLLKNIPQDSDITYISLGVRRDKSYEYPNVDKIFRDFDHVLNNNFVAKIQPTNRVYGMYAYIIGERGAKKLLDITKTLEYPIDDIVFQINGINNGKIKGYVAKKKMCAVNFSDSEIKKMGRSY